MLSRVTRLSSLTPHLAPLRFLSTADSTPSSAMASLLSTGLKAPLSDIAVEDVSGGCGSMFSVTVTAEAFQGVTRIKQQRMVQEILKKEIADMHGCIIKTKVKK